MHHPFPSHWRSLFILSLGLLLDPLGPASANGATAISDDPVSLSVIRHGNSMRISWDADVTGYILESAQSLSNPTMASVPGVVSNSVVVPIEEGNAYFRLSRSAEPVGGGEQELRPILVQGAMPVETELLASRLDEVVVETIGGWKFWRGKLDDWPVVVSKTMKGAANTGAATAIAIERYHPAAIINQGTSGGLDPQLRVYDIVLGQYSINIGSFKTAYRERGEGSNPLEWKPMDLLASEHSAGIDPVAEAMRQFPADAQLLAAAESVMAEYQKGQVVVGIIGSGEIWNSEIDRVEHLHTRYGTTVEEMETASAAQIAAFFGTPFVGIRVLSDNITNGGAYDSQAGLACQEFVYHVVKAHIRELQADPVSVR